MDYVFIFIIGLISVTIGTLVGGGGLISLPGMLILGIPIHAAIGAGKLANTLSSFSTFLTLLLKKQISFKESFWIIPVSLTGGISGSFVATRLSEDTLYIIATTLLVFAFIMSFISKANFASDEKLRPSKTIMSGLFGVGLYDGIFGPGQATILLYLFGHLKIAYIRAIGFVRLATFSSAFGAAVTFIAMGKIVWPVAIALMAGSLSGARIGIAIAQKINPRFVKPILRIVTVILIIQLISNVFVNKH